MRAGHGVHRRVLPEHAHLAALPAPVSLRWYAACGAPERTPRRGFLCPLVASVGGDGAVGLRLAWCAARLRSRRQARDRSARVLMRAARMSARHSTLAALRASASVS